MKRNFRRKEPKLREPFARPTRIRTITKRQVIEEIKEKEAVEEIKDAMKEETDGNSKIEN